MQSFEDLHSTSPTQQKTVEEEGVVYEFCPNCNRKFFEGRLRLHLKSCTDKKPFKQIKQQIAQQSQMHKTFQNPARLVSQQITAKTMTNQNENECKEVKNEDIQKPIQIQQNEEIKNTEESQKLETMDSQRIECTYCKRKFAEERIEKHEEACQKAQKKRKVFNSSVQRNNAEELKLLQSATQSQFHKKKQPMNIKNQTQSEQFKITENTQENQGQGQGQKIAKWKLEHESFIQNIKSNRQNKTVQFFRDYSFNQQNINGIEIGEKQNQAPDPIYINYVFCQYCQRKFAPLTAERHIPKCKNIFNRPKPPQKKVVSNNAEQEKEFKKTNSAQFTQYIMNQKSIDEEDEENEYNPQNYANPEPESTTTTGTHLKEKLTNQCLSEKKPPRHNKLKQLPALQKEEKNYNPHKYAELAFTQEIDLGELQQNTPFSEATMGRKQGVKITSLPPKKDFNQTGTYQYQTLLARTQTIQQVQCKYCKRWFSQRASERHIPICQNIINRQKPLTQILKERELKQQLIVEKQTFDKGFIKVGRDENKESFCTRCGSGFFEGQKYCGNCGQRRTKQVYNEKQLKTLNKS